MKILFTIGKKRKFGNCLFNQSILVNNQGFVIKYFISNFKDLILLVEKIKKEIPGLKNIKICPFSSF